MSSKIEEGMTPHTMTPQASFESSESKSSMTYESSIRKDKSSELRFKTSAQGTPRVMFFLFGVCCLLTLNVLYQELFPLKEQFGGNEFPFAFLVVDGFFNNLGQFLLLTLAGRRLSYDARISFGFSVLAAAAILFPCIAYAKCSSGDNMSSSTSMTLALIVTACMGLGLATSQSAGFPMAGKTSPKAMMWFSIGFGVVGVFPFPVVEMMTRISMAVHNKGRDDMDVVFSQMFAVFALTAAVLLSFIALYFLKFKKYSCIAQLGSGSEFEATSAGGSSSSSVGFNFGRLKPVILETWREVFFGWLTLAITFMSIAQVLVWKNRTSMENGLYVNLMFYTFQVCDVFGRYFPELGVVRISKTAVKYIAVARLIFVPLFVLSSFDVGGFNNDVWRFLMMAAFSFMNGIVLSLVPIYTTMVASAEKRNEAGMFLSLALVNGIFVGALVGEAIKRSLGE